MNDSQLNRVLKNCLGSKSQVVRKGEFESLKEVKAFMMSKHYESLRDLLVILFICLKKLNKCTLKSK